MCKLTVETQEKALAYWHIGILVYWYKRFFSGEIFS